LGARGRLIVDLTGFYNLCVDGRSKRGFYSFSNNSRLFSK